MACMNQVDDFRVGITFNTTDGEDHPGFSKTCERHEVLPSLIDIIGRALVLNDATSMAITIVPVRPE